MPAEGPASRSTCPSASLRCHPPEPVHPGGVTDSRHSILGATAPVTPSGPGRAASMELGPEWFGLDAFDVRGWERCWSTPGGAVHRTCSAASTYSGALGRPPVAGRSGGSLAMRRGVRCQANDRPDRGFAGGLAAVARTWLGPGRVCLVEDPGGEPAPADARPGRAPRIVPIPVDEMGCGSRACHRGPMSSSSLRAGSTRPAAASACRGASACCAGRPASALSSSRMTARANCVMTGLRCRAPGPRTRWPGGLLSTFSKVLFPGLRTGYMVVPERHRGPLLARSRRAPGRRPRSSSAPWRCSSRVARSTAMSGDCGLPSRRDATPSRAAWRERRRWRARDPPCARGRPLVVPSVTSAGPRPRSRRRSRPRDPHANRCPRTG